MSKKYDDETRAAVMAALLAGQTIDHVASEYHVPRSTVGRWKNEEIPLNEIQKKEIGDLLREYLEANLIAIRAQTNVFADEDWLRKQEASQLAVLHGVMTDKAIRLLEAIIY